MIDNEKDRDEAVEKELEGVPEEFFDDSEEDDEGGSLEEALEALRGDLEGVSRDDHGIN